MNKYLIVLTILSAFIYSCSEEPPKENVHGTYFGNYSEKCFGISIENGPRQGFQYFDSAGTEYTYRYITTTITNDSTAPVHLQIAFSKEYNYLRSNGDLKSKVFLLPRELTPERQHFDSSMSKELKNFLDTGTDIVAFLDRVINPNERCVMTFGVLTDMRYPDFFRMALVSRYHRSRFANDSLIKKMPLIKDSLILPLGLALENRFVIPCGQISFSN